MIAPYKNGEMEISMVYFPMFIELEGKRILVVGGGQVALRKVNKIRPYGCKVTVVAPEILDEIAQIPDIQLCRRKFAESDLADAQYNQRPALVIAATDEKELNHYISHLCHERNIPVNVVDDPKACSFIFPALVKKGDFSAGICTGGASPTAAIYYKEKLQDVLPEKIDEILSWLEEKREEIKEIIPNQAKRAGLYRRIFDGCIRKGEPLTDTELECFLRNSLTEAELDWYLQLNNNSINNSLRNNIVLDVEKEHGIMELSDENMRQHTSISEEYCMQGSVALVGAGCGKADLITVRGLRLLQQCEAVVYDDLIDPELLESVPETALRIYMGKRSGAHSASQEEINNKLIELARAGMRVVRLKGGDPYLFGRGGEEMLALQKAGIPCQEVPGIPSAIGIAAEAGIPVTHRGASRGLHIITAHTSDTEDRLPADFDHLAKMEGTLVCLMGLKQLPRIVQRLTAAGKCKETPCAVLSGGNSSHPAKVRATLETIVQAVEEARVQAPAIIIVGDVAAIDLNDGGKIL